MIRTAQSSARIAGYSQTMGEVTGPSSDSSDIRRIELLPATAGLVTVVEDGPTGLSVATGPPEQMRDYAAARARELHLAETRPDVFERRRSPGTTPRTTSGE